MPLSASLSPAPVVISGRLKASPKSSNDTDDEPQYIDRPSGSGSSRAKAGAESTADEDAAQTEKEAAEAKRRHQADLELHAYEAPKAERPQDDWQVAYVWAFIVKFNMRERIKRLECLEDFEQSLQEPVANRPDDILEGVLIRFLHNLKPGLRGLDCTNVQHHLLNYCNEQLIGPSDFTVWDRPWAPNEEARGSCCNSAPNRTELGKLRYVGEPPHERVERNPLWQAVQKGNGIFELDWRERASLLRQLVDWQLTHSDPIRAIINKENHAPVPKGTTVPESQGLVKIEPIGMDRSKQRIWMLDNSGRIYKSGNPFKRPCPIFAISSNKTEMQEQIDKWTAHGDSPKPDLSTKAAVKGKSKAEIIAGRKAIKGIEDEKLLAGVAAERMELVEKEDTRIARARKRLADSAKIYNQAEFRSTRTRRTTRKIDYSYGDDTGDEEEEAYEQPRRTSRRGEPPALAPSRPIIPGERKSARLTRKDLDDGASISYNEGTNGDGRSSSAAMEIDSRPASPKEDEEEDDEMNGGGGPSGSRQRKVNGGSEDGYEESDGDDGAGMNGDQNGYRNGESSSQGSGLIEAIIAS